MRILIVGGGIAGLTLAWWLHRSGHAPVVLERSSRLRDEGYMLDFFGPGYAVAERMGLLPALDRIHYPIPRLRFLRSDGTEKFSLDYRTLRRTLFDDRHFNFLRGDLERLLYDQIKDNVEVRFGTGVGSLEQDEAQVRATVWDGTAEAFDVVVGADGVHSAVRALVFGEDAAFARFLGYHTAAFILDDPPQRGLPQDAFSSLTEVGRQVATYPIRGDRLATFFVHKADGVLDDFSVEAARAELRRLYGDMDWVVPELVERSDQVADVYFDVVEQITMPRWSQGRVALIGDACQCVSLVAGQGASMAMAGAYVLAQELAEGPDLASAFERYEQRLKPEVEERQRAARRMARWFVPDTRLQLLVRDVATRMTTWPVAASLIKRGFAPGAAKL